MSQLKVVNSLKLNFYSLLEKNSQKHNKSLSMRFSPSVIRLFLRMIAYCSADKFEEALHGLENTIGFKIIPIR